MPITRYWFFALLLLGGCSQAPEPWVDVASNPQAWHYMSAERYSLRPPGPNSRIGDTSLKLYDAQVLAYQDLDTNRSRPLIIALPNFSMSDLITGSVRQASSPSNIGKVLPTIMDRRYSIHFLSWTNGAWYSTNILRTSQMAFTVTKEKAEGTE